MPIKRPHIPSSLPPAALEFIAARFRILSDPTRLAVLHSLHDGELTVGTIVARTRGDQGNVSKHLGLLSTAGMVSKRRDGNFAYYSISDPVVFELCDLVCHKLSNQLGIKGPAAVVLTSKTPRLGRKV